MNSLLKDTSPSTLRLEEKSLRSGGELAGRLADVKRGLFEVASEYAAAQEDREIVQGIRNHADRIGNLFNKAGKIAQEEYDKTGQWSIHGDSMRHLRNVDELGNVFLPIELGEVKNSGYLHEGILNAVLDKMGVEKDRRLNLHEAGKHEFLLDDKSVTVELYQKSDDSHNDLGVAVHIDPLYDENFQGRGEEGKVQRKRDLMYALGFGVGQATFQHHELVTADEIISRKINPFSK